MGLGTFVELIRGDELVTVTLGEIIDVMDAATGPVHSGAELVSGKTIIVHRDRGESLWTMEVREYGVLVEFSMAMDSAEVVGNIYAHSL